MSTISTGRESDRFMLRLPDGMRDRIKAAAEKHKRSMNAEIVAVLEDAFPPPPEIGETLELIGDLANLFRQFKGRSTLEVLSDVLDGLAVDLASMDDLNENERAALERYLKKYTTYNGPTNAVGKRLLDLDEK